jgi:hypothetical protein
VEESFLAAVQCTWVNYVRQTEIHKAEPLVPQPSVFEFELAIENLKNHKLPGFDQIPAKNE